MLGPWEETNVTYYHYSFHDDSPITTYKRSGAGENHVVTSKLEQNFGSWKPLQRRKRLQEYFSNPLVLPMKKKLKVERPDGWFQASQWLGIRSWGEKADTEKKNTEELS